MLRTPPDHEAGYNYLLNHCYITLQLSSGRSRHRLTTSVKVLYDKVYREDILFHAYRLARSNKGAPGVDGQSFAEIEAMGLEGWLSGIRDVACPRLVVQRLS